MSDKQRDEILRACLAALDAGLTPEETLAVWPEQRDEIEPLLRQALLLRVAFAGKPSEGFQQRTREKLLFAAGREVKDALAREPSLDFVAQARFNLLRSAGAQTQEALREVPPPRLPFWQNARRRFLEAAIAPTRRPAPRPLAFALRTSLSVAMVVVAVAVSALIFTTSESTPSVNAELAALEQELQQLEAQAAAGDPNAIDALIDLSQRTAALIEKLDSEPTSNQATTKLPAIIDRQQDVANLVATDGQAPPLALAQAQTSLNQAEEMVRVLAALVDTPVPVKTTVPTATATPAETPLPTPTSAPVPGKEVRITFLASDDTFDLSWVEIRIASMRLVVPSTWSIIGVSPNDEGLATLETRFLRVDGPNVILIVDTQTAEINAIIDGQPLSVRSEEPQGEFIDVNSLVQNAASAALELRHLIETFELLGPLSD